MKAQEKHPKRYWEDEKWAFEHYAELVKKYPDKWVAVINKKVVSAGIDIQKIEKIARKKTGKTLFPVIFIESSSAIYEN
jgi:hypothetical protein